MKDHIILVLGIAFFIALGIAKLSYLEDRCNRHGGTLNSGVCYESDVIYQVVNP